MKTYVMMCGNKDEAAQVQRETWTALCKMGVPSTNDFNNSTIVIAAEIRLLHLTPADLERLYGLKIEGFRTYGTFGTTSGSQEILDRLKLCERG